MTKERLVKELTARVERLHRAFTPPKDLPKGFRKGIDIWIPMALPLDENGRMKALYRAFQALLLENLPEKPKLFFKASCSLGAPGQLPGFYGGYWRP